MLWRGGIGSGIMLLIMVEMCVEWRFRKFHQNEARSTSLFCKLYSSENPSVKLVNMDATGIDHRRTLGQETVGIQYTESPYRRVPLSKPEQSFDVTALLDQLKQLSVNVDENCKRLWAVCYAALCSI